MRRHKLGNDFSKSFKMNLLPGIVLARGYWRSEIQFITDNPTTNNTGFNHSSNISGGEPSNFDVIVGQDVREITFLCYRHNSFPGNPNTYIKYTMRVDRILLLNLIYKLVGSTIILKNL